MQCKAEMLDHDGGLAEEDGFGLGALLVADADEETGAEKVSGNDGFVSPAKDFGHAKLDFLLCEVGLA